jgi:hypothetical protein
MINDEILDKTVHAILERMGKLERQLTAAEIKQDFPCFSDNIVISSLSDSIELEALWAAGGTQLVELASDSWDHRFGELRAFKAAEGHCNVPARWPDNMPLATWVSSQRTCHNKFVDDPHDPRASITPERIDRLEALGFVWSRRI